MPLKYLDLRSELLRRVGDVSAELKELYAVLELYVP
jgi:hypothetical protein